MVDLIQNRGLQRVVHIHDPKDKAPSSILHIQHLLHMLHSWSQRGKRKERDFATVTQEKPQVSRQRSVLQVKFP